MTESSGLLNYTSPVDFKTIDRLLNDLKESKGFINIDKDTGKRVYSIVVECLENIIKYSANESAGKPNMDPAISVLKQKDKIIIRAGNSIEAEKTDGMILKIDMINSLDDSTLIDMLKKKINMTREKDDKGAGLGLMLMKLKSGNKIAFNLTSLVPDYNYLELTISVNEYLS